MVDSDTLLRLRLIRAGYDGDERTTLLTLARQLRLPRAHAAIVLAAQARRDALDGSPEDALEHWRQAVAHAIHEGRTNDAAGWLYAIRGVNIRFRPLTSRIDEEHLLAQALPRSSGGRLIRRVRDPETDARRAALEGRPLEAIQAGRRWLADSIIVGDWVDERAATELLGDLYAKNAEPERAAGCYQWAGETEKLTKLAAAVGDRLLPLASVGSGPWWQQTTSLACIAAQQDMVDDAAAGALLSLLVNLVARGRVAARASWSIARPTALPWGRRRPHACSPDAAPVITHKRCWTCSPMMSHARRTDTFTMTRSTSRRVIRSSCTTRSWSGRPSCGSSIWPRLALPMR